MKARKVFTALGVVAVAAVAGAISYRHQQHLAVTHGQPAGLAYMWPLCVDGLVTVTAIAISTDRADGMRPRLWALAGFWLGVTVSVATNWLATDGGIVAHAVSAFPALAFLVAVESLSSKPRPRPARSDGPSGPAEPVAATASHDAVGPVPVVSGMPDTVTEPATPRRASRPRPATLTAAAKVASARRRLPDASAAQIAAKAGVSESTARRHLAALDDAVVNPPTGADAAPINGFGLLGELEDALEV